MTRLTGSDAMEKKDPIVFVEIRGVSNHMYYLLFSSCFNVDNMFHWAYIVFFSRITCLFGQNFGGQNFRKSDLLPKILSAENFYPPKILSAEIFCPLKSKTCQINTNLMLKTYFPFLWIVWGNKKQMKKFRRTKRLKYRLGAEKFVRRTFVR